MKSSKPLKFGHFDTYSSRSRSKKIGSHLSTRETKAIADELYEQSSINLDESFKFLLNKSV